MLIFSLMSVLISNAVATNINKFTMFSNRISQNVKIYIYKIIYIIINFLYLQTSIYILSCLYNMFGFTNYYYLILPISVCITKILMNLSRGNKEKHKLTIKLMLIIFLRSLIISYFIVPCIKEISIYVIPICFKFIFNFISILLSVHILITVKCDISEPSGEHGDTPPKSGGNPGDAPGGKPGGEPEGEPVTKATYEGKGKKRVRFNYEEIGEEPSYEGKGKKRMSSHNEMNDQSMVIEYTNILNDLNSKVPRLEKIDSESGDIISHYNLLVLKKDSIIEVIGDGTKEDREVNAAERKLNENDSEWHKLAAEVTKSIHKAHDINESLKEKLDKIESRFSKNENSYLSKVYSDSEDSSSE